VQFQVPDTNAQCVARRLTVLTARGSGPSGPPGSGYGSAPQIRVWNYRSEGWLTLSGSGNTFPVPRPERFMSPEGQVRVLISSPGGNCSIGDVSLDAEVEVR